MLAPSDNGSILGQRALAYAARGLWVFPCLPRAKEPATANGFKDATCDPGLIVHWWKQNADYNIGIATGRLSHAFVLVIDGGEAETELKKLEAQHGALPSTVECITGKGRHLFFDWPRGQTIRNSASRVAPGVDVRGEGGYVIAPPSIHPSGKTYCWSIDSGNAIVSAPTWLLQKVVAPTNGYRITPPAEWRALVRDGVGEGRRNDSVTRLTGMLLRQRIDAQVVHDLLSAWNQVHCAPPLDDLEIATIVNSVAGAELRRRRHVDHQARQWRCVMTATMENIVRLSQLQESGELPPSAEDAIALLFAERFGDVLRYVAQWGKWLSFEDVLWRADNTLFAYNLVREICREVALECDKAISSVASAKTVAAVERLARSDRRLAATAAQWDAVDWSYNAGDPDD